MSFVVSAQVKNAIETGTPVVALETAVLTSGLPHSAWNESFGTCPPCIDQSLPINWALACAMTNAVADQGALPVWIGILQGTFVIGMNPEELRALAIDETAAKVSLSSSARAMQQKLSAGTTVAATLLACKLASPLKPIRVFATGGIGGMHQNWSSRLDISADLTALATTPTCVVASGAKSILDLHATVEILETIGVPILGVECNQFPPFIEQSCEIDPTITRMSSVDEVVQICTLHWNSLKLNSAILAAVPAPEKFAVERGCFTDALKQAEQTWAKLGLPSITRTPYLLSALSEITQGKSLIANLELLCNNACIAGKIAVALAR